ncbi:MAG: glycosyltransferase family 2 protein [Acidobacteria bacterium]|nr:glycosyltransferase family 2 protein [Acidobacteriota bacterium]
MVIRCLESLLQGSLVPRRIVLVDSHSTDGSDRAVERLFPDVSLLRLERNMGYAAALNRGIDQACSQGDELLLLLNNDVIFAPDAVEVLASHWHQRAGLLGPKVFRLGEKSRLDAAWGRMLFHHVVCRMVGENQSDSARFSRIRPVDALLGCALLTSCAVMREVGPLDPDYFIYMEEIDFAYRIRQLGREILFVPDAQAWHAGGHATSESARKAVKLFYVRRNTVLFLRKHGNFLHWSGFLLFSLASLLFFLVTFRWNDLRLRIRGYIDGFRAPNTSRR